MIFQCIYEKSVLRIFAILQCCKMNFLKIWKMKNFVNTGVIYQKFDLPQCKRAISTGVQIWLINFDNFLPKKIINTGVNLDHGKNTPVQSILPQWKCSIPYIRGFLKAMVTGFWHRKVRMGVLIQDYSGSGRWRVKNVPFTRKICFLCVLKIGQSLVWNWDWETRKLINFRIN